MKIVVGLGNPGRNYEGTRHNVGFAVVDSLASGVSGGRFASRFQGQLAEMNEAGEKVLLLKPETFMNLSGRSVRQAVDFYHLGPGGRPARRLRRHRLAPGQAADPGERDARRPQWSARHPEPPGGCRLRPPADRGGRPARRGGGSRARPLPPGRAACDRGCRRPGQRRRSASLGAVQGVEERA